MQDISALKRTPTNTEMDFHEVRAEEKRLREKLLTVIENNFATNTGETYPMDFVKSWFDYQSVQLMKAN